MSSHRDDLAIRPYEMITKSHHTEYIWTNPYNVPTVDISHERHTNSSVSHWYCFYILWMDDMINHPYEMALIWMTICIIGILWRKSAGQVWSPRAPQQVELWYCVVVSPNKRLHKQSSFCDFRCHNFDNVICAWPDVPQIKCYQQRSHQWCGGELHLGPLVTPIFPAKKTHIIFLKRHYDCHALYMQL